MAFVSPFFMVLVSPLTEYCYFHGFTASRGPEIRALKCRTDKRISQKTRCFQNAPKNKKNIKKEKKTRREEAKERRKSTLS